MEVPVQYFQSIIALELAVTGALLFEIRFFEPREVAEASGRELPSPWLRLLTAVLLGATLLGSLDGIAHHGGSASAIAVTLGLALSVLPILLRVLPPVVQGTRTDPGRRYSIVTVVGLIMYGAAVAALVLLLNR
jgi:hypothetical protein